MPIIMHEFDMPFPDEPPAEGELADRIAMLERHVEALEGTVRDLARYCQQLEHACRESLADRPGRAPFPPLARS
jgi:hypothetical protein